MKVRRPTHEEIAKRAYELFLARGCRHGQDRDDWLQAEYELMQLPVRKLAELPPPPKPPQTKPKTGLPSLIEVVRTAMSPGSGARRSSAQG
jgi:hypothetical protein